MMVYQKPLFEESCPHICVCCTHVRDNVAAQENIWFPRYAALLKMLKKKSLKCQIVQRKKVIRFYKRLRLSLTRLSHVSTRGPDSASIHEQCCSSTTVCWSNSNGNWRPTTARSRDIIKGQGRYHTHCGPCQPLSRV